MSDKNDQYARDKASTPINWPDEDPFGEGVAVSFMDESSFPNGRDIQNEILDGSNQDGRESFMVASNPTCEVTDTFSGTPSSSNGGNKRRLSSGRRDGDSAPISRRKKKPKGMPKRPLSAYNLYFQSERAKILEAADNGEGGKIGFEGLGKIIGKKWRVLPESERKTYDKLAEKDSIRYRKEMEVYNQMKHKRMDDYSEKLSYKSLMRSAETSPLPPQDQQTLDGSANFAGLQSLTVTNPQPNEPHYSTSMVEKVSPPHQDFHEQQQSHPPQNHAPFHPYAPSSPPHVPPPYHLQYGAPDIGVSRTPVAATPPVAAPSQLSFPPLPPGVDPVPPNQLPVPPGMEIILPDRNGNDRKYRVQYACYSMTKEAAHQYIESLSGIRPGTTSSGVTVDVSQRHVRTFPAAWGGAPGGF